MSPAEQRAAELAAKRAASSKTISLTKGEHAVIVAILDAVQLGYNARAAAQTIQEMNHDVEPVAEGSEEEQAIWEAIHETFDKIRMA